MDICCPLLPLLFGESLLLSGGELSSLPLQLRPTHVCTRPARVRRRTRKICTEGETRNAVVPLPCVRIPINAEERGDRSHYLGESGYLRWARNKDLIFLSI